MTKHFLAIFDFLSTRRKIALTAVFILILVLAAFSSRIRLHEDIAGFLPQSRENEKINFVYRNIPGASQIIVQVSLKDTMNRDTEECSQIITGYAERFLSVVDSLGGAKYIKKINYKADIRAMNDIVAFLGSNLPYFLTEKDFARIDSIVAVCNIQSVIEEDKRLLTSPMGMAVKQNVLIDPLHFSAPVLERLKKFNTGDQYILIDDYIFTPDGQKLLIFIEPANPVSETRENAVLSDIIETAAGSVAAGADISYFGASLVAVSNARQVKTDSQISIIISMLLISAILFAYFRNLKAILLILLPVLFGVLFAFTIISVAKGSISAIALGAGSVVLGIAVNYSMHFLIHFKEHPDPRRVIKDISNPLLIGNITTVGAFLSLLFISAESMRDFGLFAALSLIGTIFFVLIFLPLLSKGLTGREVNTATSLFSGFTLNNPRIIRLSGGILILGTIVIAFFSNKVSFETNMQKINFMTGDQKKSFSEFSRFTTIGQKSSFVVAEGKNLNDALKIFEQQYHNILHSPGKISVSSIGTFLPSDSTRKIRLARWKTFTEKHGAMLAEEVAEAAEKTGFRPDAFSGFSNLLTKDFQLASDTAFSIIKETLLAGFLIEKNERTMVVSHISSNDDPSDMNARLNKIPGSFTFNSSSLTDSLVRSLSSDFNFVLYVCAILVFGFLWLAFGRIELGLLAFCPMVVSWIWILGIMGITGIHFNIVNIILATFIFGLGDDYVIFITDGLMHEYKFGRKLLQSYTTSIILSALTMFIGIGVLAFARHPAMQSLGYVAIIGMTTVSLVAFIIPSFLFRFLTLKKNRKRLMPITIRNFCVTVYAFVFFLLGSLILTVSGFILITILGPSQKHKLMYHKLLCLVSRLVVRLLPGVGHNIRGVKENFEKPAVIICNHQAHIDLMYVLSLSPKIIVLTNKWVWRFPVYSMIIRYADFYPVHDEGIESSIGYLKPLVNQGYSIVIFPEGTRSEDCSIKRFHRGAFYLAEQLNLDILPVLFHGIGHVLPKTEMILRKGSVTTNILPRITPDNISFGDTYMKRAKMIRQLFVKEYSNLSNEVETMAYFRSLVLHNYIYKGRDIEKKAKRILSFSDNYKEIIDSIPGGSNILLSGCETGVFPLLLSLVRKDLTIVAVDTDEENILIAENCASKPENLKYRKGAICDENISNYDYVIDLVSVTMTAV